MFNARIEAFNQLLDLDVVTHEYAYLVDSNLHLSYDFTMFHRRSGTLNNRGLRQVFGDLRVRIADIDSWLTNSSIVPHTESNDTKVCPKKQINGERNLMTQYSSNQIQRNNQIFRSH